MELPLWPWEICWLTGTSRKGQQRDETMELYALQQKAITITIIFAYQVCKAPTNRIGNTAWHQQRALNAAHQDHIHPQKAFIADLLQAIQSLQWQNHDIIVAGDFNETLEDSNSGLL